MSAFSRQPFLDDSGVNKLAPKFGKNKKPMDIGFAGQVTRNTRHEAEFHLSVAHSVPDLNFNSTLFPDLKIL
jgi:hypothetical protein